MFEDLVARQAGVVSLSQAAALGYSAARVRRRLREGCWRRLHPGVVLVGGHRLTDEGRVRAASLWAAETAVVCGAAAAHWHGMLGRAPGDRRPDPSVASGAALAGRARGCGAMTSRGRTWRSCAACASPVRA